MQRLPVWVDKVKHALKASLIGAEISDTTIALVFDKNRQDEGYTVTFSIAKVPNLFLDLAKLQSIFHAPSIMLDIDKGQTLIHGTVDSMPINTFIKIT